LYQDLTVKTAMQEENRWMILAWRLLWVKYSTGDNRCTQIDKGILRKN